MAQQLSEHVPRVRRTEPTADSLPVAGYVVASLAGAAPQIPNVARGYAASTSVMMLTR